MKDAVVVKCGGLSVDGEGPALPLMKSLAALADSGSPLCVVHGGGAQIGRLLDRLGIRSRFERGLRVTSPEAMEVVEMALSGSVNKNLTAALNRALGSDRAVGISGRDGDLLRARPLSTEAGADLGRVGEIGRVNPGLLHTLFEAGRIPVVAPVANGVDQQAWNINADMAATALAIELQAARLVFSTDVAGVLDAQGQLMPSIDSSLAARLIEEGVIGGGMIPKVECALRALAGGVQAVDIVEGSAPLALTAGAGTRITD